MAVNRVAFIWLILPVSVFAQTNRYFVSFKDKANSNYTVASPLQFLSQKSIDRRTRENFTMSEEDLPVNQDYVQQVKALGAECYFTSKWFNGLLVQTEASIVSSIRALPFVTKVELVAWGARLTGGRAKANQKFERLSATTSLQNQAQLQMIGLDKMHTDGFHGEGIDIAVFDAGFNSVDTLSAFKALYQEGRIKAAFNFVQNSSNVYAGYPHGTWVLSIMAGNVPNKYLGGAYKANFFLYQTEDVFTEYRVEEYNWLFAAEKADSAGVDVINSSLGYYQFDDLSMDYTYKDMDGKTSVVARAARKVFERGIVVVNSAGNEGNKPWKYIITPSDAAGVISCGGIDDLGKLASFSSIGPASDGRVKPDVCAMAYNTVLIDIDGYIRHGNGTSFSSPLVACLAAGLRQALPNASADEIYSRLINSASQANKPDNFFGYGIPNFESARTLTDFEDEFEIYPNPTTNLLKIIFKNPNAHEVKATLYNSAGQKVFEINKSVTWEDNPYEIDLSHFSAGLFFLRIDAGANSSSQKILKMN
ncbi:MAG: S8 family serine peptidase [Bacteroidetes bacterium]|nr:S8 family serine peptidase [Bacteroidota bacterium]